jgi:quinol monooxygenase YgiN
VNTQLIAAVIACAIVASGSNAHAAASNEDLVYVVVHVDIEPSQVKAAIPILRAFVRKAGDDPAVQRIDVLQQTGATNHFTLIEVFRSRSAYDGFVERPYVVDMRTRLQPYLGSPFDERLHKAVSMVD